MGKMAVADFCCQRGTFDSAKEKIKNMNNKGKNLSLCHIFFLFGVPIGLYSPQKGFDFTVERGSRTYVR